LVKIVLGKKTKRLILFFLLKKNYYFIFRYTNKVSVEPRVYKNLKLFMENKEDDDDLFDRLTVINNIKKIFFYDFVFYILFK
jgi:hypothetical protein